MDTEGTHGTHGTDEKRAPRTTGHVPPPAGPPEPSRMPPGLPPMPSHPPAAGSATAPAAGSATGPATA
ncbi:hypothetical protein J7E97_25535, partial [Streptomyces sp. ISL-66]|nr:hypothetical protein [Streptomyces sp. ISL-66]